MRVGGGAEEVLALLIAVRVSLLICVAFLRQIFLAIFSSDF